MVWVGGWRRRHWGLVQPAVHGDEQHGRLERTALGPRTGEPSIPAPHSAAWSAGDGFKDWRGFRNREIGDDPTSSS
jgi:hypothetical protein